MSIIYGPLKIVKRIKKLWKEFCTTSNEGSRLSILFLEKSPTVVHLQFAYIGDYRVHFRTFIMKSEFTDEEILKTFHYALELLWVIESRWLRENQLPKRGKMDDYC